MNYFAFNYWQYTDLLVFWGGSAGEGIILAPNPGVIDAAHRNGVPVLGTIFFRRWSTAGTSSGFTTSCRRTAPRSPWPTS